MYSIVIYASQGQHCASLIPNMLLESRVQAVPFLGMFQLIVVSIDGPANLPLDGFQHERVKSIWFSQ